MRRGLDDTTTYGVRQQRGQLLDAAVAEFGAHGLDPDAKDFAERYAEQAARLVSHLAGH
ncbi:hypothetical protein [Kribbella sp. NBC_00359]|uniref:hypothetical protein n=1 Tax=Kribbella sp. NBC_00359 TaxID=2975966 RepID=UPI002E1E3FC1